MHFDTQMVTVDFPLEKWKDIGDNQMRDFRRFESVELLDHVGSVIDY